MLSNNAPVRDVIENMTDIFQIAWPHCRNILQAGQERRQVWDTILIPLGGDAFLSWTQHVVLVSTIEG
jgi:hypothetical protein